MSFRLVTGNENLAIATARNDLNPARVCDFISDELITDRFHLVEMPFLGNIAHDDNPPAQLVKVTFLDLGMIEFSQAHAPTVIGRSNLDRCLEHRYTSTGEFNRRGRFLQAHVRAVSNTGDIARHLTAR